MTRRPAEAEIVATTPLSCVSEHNIANDLEVLPLKVSKGVEFIVNMLDSECIL